MGKRRLEKAIQQVRKQHPVAEFKVHWLPYQLNPAAAEEGISKMQYYNDKFGPARVAQMMPAMTVSFIREPLCKMELRLLSICCSIADTSCVNNLDTYKSPCLCAGCT